MIKKFLKSIDTITLHHTSIPAWLRYKHGKQIEHMPINAQIAKPYSIWTAPSETLINEVLTWHGPSCMIFLQTNKENDFRSSDQRLQ